MTQSTKTAATLEMGRVALTVNDIGAVGDYYEKAIGLAPLSRDGETAVYGAGDRPLLELRQDRSARQRSPREAGLFHTAFLLPARADLGRFVRHLIDDRIPVVGASDHAVSEALYLTDPEGNGIEVYSDRPADQWRWTGGEVHMVTEQLDVAGVVAAGAGTWAGAPDGSVVGHVHLQVGALPAAETFWSKLVGLDVTSHYPGGIFYSADRYHHHLATNVWNSRGAGPRDLPSTGLSEVEIRLNGARAEALRARIGADQAQATQDGREIVLTDPWNTPVALRVAL